MNSIRSIFDLPDNMLMVLTVLKQNCSQECVDGVENYYGTMSWSDLRKIMRLYADGPGQDRSRATELAMRCLMATFIEPVEHPGQKFSILQNFRIVNNEMVYFQINPDFLKYTAGRSIQ